MTSILLLYDKDIQPQLSQSTFWDPSQETNLISYVNFHNSQDCLSLCWEQRARVPSKRKQITLAEERKEGIRVFTGTHKLKV